MLIRSLWFIHFIITARGHDRLATWLNFWNVSLLANSGGFYIDSQFYTYDHAKKVDDSFTQLATIIILLRIVQCSCICECQNSL